MADAQARGATGRRAPVPAHRRASVSPAALLTRRWTERLLLLPVGLLLALGAEALARSEAGAPDSIWRWVVIFCTVFAVGQIAITLLTPDADQLLLPLTAMLSAIGFLFVARLEPDFAGKQLVWYALGIVMMVAVLALLPDPRILRRYQYVAAATALGLMLVTAVAGR